MVQYVGANNAPSATPVVLPANAVGDRAVYFVCGKPETTADIALTGYQFLGKFTGGAGAGGTGDQGLTYVQAFIKNCDGTTTAPTLSGGAGGNTATLGVLVMRPDAGYLWRDAVASVPIVGGEDTVFSGGFVAVTGAYTSGDEPDGSNGDGMITISSIPTDSSNSVDSVTASATGMSGGTHAFRSYNETSAGLDCAHAAATWLGFAGTPSSGITIDHQYGAISSESGSAVAIALRQVLLAGSASLTLSADGVAVAGASPASGTASLSLSGSGAAESSTVATASLSLVGDGDAEGNVDATGTATLDLSGVAVVAAAAPAASASLSLSAAGDLSGTLAANGTAALDLSGTGGATVAASASASLDLSGTGSGQVPQTATASLSLSAAGDPSLPVSGTASLDLSLTGGVSIARTGTAAVSLSAAGSAAIARSGTASLTFSAAGAAGIVVVGTVIVQGAGQIILTDEALVFPSELRLELMETEIHRAPASLTVTLSGAQAQTDIVFDIDGTDVLTISADSDGMLGPTSINLTELLGTPGSHTLTATQVTTGGTIEDSEIFTVILDPTTYPAPPTTDTGAVDVPAAVAHDVRHWVLQDLLPGGLTQYVFPHNPRTMSSPHYEHALVSRHSTAQDGKVHVFQAPGLPKEWQFSGFCPTQAHQEAILAYRALNRRFWLIDHHNRAWKVLFTHAEFVPRLRTNYNGENTDWGSDFTVTAVVLDQDFTVPT